MTTTPRSFNLSDRELNAKPFPARYPGNCAACGEPFAAGDLIRYIAQDTIAGEACCAGFGGVGRDVLASDDGERVDPREVMPRGKRPNDKCPRCFIVPSSNGSCGCDW